ncbi:hypothetical protein MXB_2219, partial [Myxobolus squamalis]
LVKFRNTKKNPTNNFISPAFIKIRTVNIERSRLKSPLFGLSIMADTPINFNVYKFRRNSEYKANYRINDADTCRRIIGKLKEQFQGQLISLPLKVVIDKKLNCVHSETTRFWRSIPSSLLWMTDKTIVIVRSNQHVLIEATLKMALHPFM